MGSDRILAASKKGQFKIVKFGIDTIIKEKEFKPVGNIREEKIVCQIGNANDFVTCGHHCFGDPLWSVVVIRGNDSREIVFEQRKR